MIEIARVSRLSSASPAAFFSRWCDLPTHPEWAPSMASFELDGPFRLGATGTSVSADGRRSTFTVTEIDHDRSYADATDIGGATLTVHHLAEDTTAGTLVTLTAWVEGLEAARHARELDGIGDDLARDLASLAALLERER